MPLSPARCQAEPPLTSDRWLTARDVGNQRLDRGQQVHRDQARVDAPGDRPMPPRHADEQVQAKAECPNREPLRDGSWFPKALTTLSRSRGGPIAYPVVVVRVDE